jgi:hypothetical protein
MAIDTRQLSPTDLVRMLNSTPLGLVTSIHKVNRQMNAAGYRIGDGKRINLLRYVAWLARERDKPQPPKPDNHWFDCLVGCAAAASMVGVKPAGEAAPMRQRKKYTQEDLRRR